MFEVRKITLPSGKTVEVVYFTPQSDELHEPVRDLTVCPQCQHDRVYPTEWHEEGDGWNILMRCPDCENFEEGVFDHPTVEFYDESLNVGTDQVIDELEKMTQYNMRETLARWQHALANNLILPEDF